MPDPKQPQFQDSPLGAPSEPTYNNLEFEDVYFGPKNPKDEEGKKNEIKIDQNKSKLSFEDKPGFDLSWQELQDWNNQSKLIGPFDSRANETVSERWNKAQKEDLHEVGRRDQSNQRTAIGNIKSIGNTPAVINALEKGVYQGVVQNVELLTGMDNISTTKDYKWDLTNEQLDALRNAGAISMEEYQEYVQKRNALPFLTSLTAAVTNSLMIAFELPEIGTVQLTGAGAKFFSKAGIKYAAKNLGNLGKQSWKLMGAGANLRATRETVKEIKAMDNPDVWDYAGAIAKNYFYENTAAAMEGISEGLIPNLKFGGIAAKNLLKYNKSQWKELGKNIFKKAVTGLGTEAGTEQTTDMWQDVFKGTNSSVLFSQLRGTSDEKKAAWENLLIEGLTGYILGNTLGMNEYFGQNIYDSTIDMVKSGELTEREGELVLEIARDEQAAQNFIEKVQESNRKKTVPKYLREAKAGFNFFKSMGSKIDHTDPIFETEQAEHDEAMARVKQDLPTAVADVDAEITRMVMDEKLEPNILDAMLLLGKRNSIKYLDGLQEQDSDFNFIDDFVANHPAMNTSHKVMNRITKSSMDKILYKVLKYKRNFVDTLGLDMLNMPEAQKAFFTRDVLAAAAMDFDSLGWDMLGKKWEGIVAPELITDLKNRVPSLAATSGVNIIGEKILEDSFDQMANEVNEEYLSQLAKEQSVERENLSKLTSELDNAINETGPEGPFNQRIPDDLIHYKEEGERIAETLGLIFEGLGKMGNTNYAQFSKSKGKEGAKDTFTVIVPEAFTVSAVNDKLKELRPLSQTVFTEEPKEEREFAFEMTWVNKARKYLLDRLQPFVTIGPHDDGLYTSVMVDSKYVVSSDIVSRKGSDWRSGDFRYAELPYTVQENMDPWDLTDLNLSPTIAGIRNYGVHYYSRVSRDLIAFPSGKVSANLLYPQVYELYVPFVTENVKTKFPLRKNIYRPRRQTNPPQIAGQDIGARRMSFKERVDQYLSERGSYGNARGIMELTPEQVESLDETAITTTLIQFLESPKAPPKFRLDDINFQLFKPKHRIESEIKGIEKAIQTTRGELKATLTVPDDISDLDGTFVATDIGVQVGKEKEHEQVRKRLDSQEKHLASLQTTLARWTNEKGELPIKTFADVSNYEAFVFEEFKEQLRKELADLEAETGKKVVSIPKDRLLAKYKSFVYKQFKIVYAAESLQMNASTSHPYGFTNNFVGGETEWVVDGAETLLFDSHYYKGGHTYRVKSKAFNETINGIGWYLDVNVSNPNGANNKFFYEFQTDILDQINDAQDRGLDVASMAHAVSSAALDAKVHILGLEPLIHAADIETHAGIENYMMHAATWRLNLTDKQKTSVATQAKATFKSLIPIYQNRILRARQELIAAKALRSLALKHLKTHGNTKAWQLRTYFKEKSVMEVFPGVRSEEVASIVTGLAGDKDIRFAKDIRTVLNKLELYAARRRAELKRIGRQVVLTQDYLKMSPGDLGYIIEYLGHEQSRRSEWVMANYMPRTATTPGPLDKPTIFQHWYETWFNKSIAHALWIAKKEKHSEVYFGGFLWHKPIEGNRSASLYASPQEVKYRQAQGKKSPEGPGAFWTALSKIPNITITEMVTVPWSSKPVIKVDISQLDAKEVKYFQKTTPAAHIDSYLPDPGISYSQILAGFEGKTIKDLHNFLKGNNIVDAKYNEILDKLVPYLKDVPISFNTELSNDTAGQYIPKGWQGKPEQIYINPNFLAHSTLDPLKTLLHEAIHAWTVQYMYSPEGAIFKGQIGQAIKYVRDVIGKPEFATKMGMWTGSQAELRRLVNEYTNDTAFRADLENYLSNEEEFIAGILSDTTRLRLLTDQISVVSNTERQSLTQFILDLLKAIWQKIIGEKADQGNLTQWLVDTMWSYHEDVGSFNNKFRHDGREGTIRKLRDAGFEVKVSGTQEQVPVNENQDDEQVQADESVEWQYANNITHLCADIEGIDVNEFRNSVKKLPTVLNFFYLLDDLDKKSDNAITKRIAKLWSEGGYKEKSESEDAFEFRFITGLYTFLRSSKTVTFVTVETNYADGLHTFEVKRQPFVFTQGDGVTRGSYGRNVVLDTFLPQVASIMGIPKGKLTMAYISGFEISNNNKFQTRVSAKQLAPYHIGMKKEDELSTEILADKINASTRGQDVCYVYLGNFGGNNTLPLLAIPGRKRNKGADYKAIVEKARGLLQSINVTMPKSEGAILTQAFRMVLEDLWFGRPPVDGKFAQNSVFLTTEFGDLNKIWKRGKKFLVEDNFLATDSTNMERILGDRTYTGITIEGGEQKEIILNTLIFNSNDEGTITLQTGYKVEQGKNVPVKQTIPLRSLLINNYNTEKTDGIIYYLIGEFDHIYHNVHGTIKDGVIKAVYGSRAGEEPMYLKFSMQGITRDSALGQLMVASNVALMVSDTAAKITLKKPTNLSQGTGTIQSGVFQLNLKNFNRIKEELNTDLTGGTVKQMLNSSGLTKGNTLLGENEAYHAAIANFVSASAQIALQDVNEMSSPKGLIKILRNIIEYPQSPRERAISRSLRSLTKLSDKDFLDGYAGLINHPTISKQIRQRLFRPLDSAIQGRVGGMRATLRADVGWFNAPGNVDPVNNPYTKDMLLISQPSDATVIKHAFPEAGLYSLIRKFVELQRQESRMLSQGTQDRTGYYITENEVQKEVKQKRYIDVTKQEITDQIKAMGEASTDESRKAALSTGDIRKAINHDDYVKEWKKNLVFGKDNLDGTHVPGILNSVSGSLTEDWVVISEDFARKYGVKPGDQLLAIITPTDSPLGIIAVKVAGVAPVYGEQKVTDRMSVVFNSEYIQSIVGKDYDIDTISLIPFDPSYWKGNDFETVWNTIYKLKTSYKSWLAKEATKLLDRPVDQNEVFNKDVYPEFMKKFIVSHLGNRDTGKLAGVKEFTAQEHFFAVDRAYLVDPNKAIVRRQFHTMLSAIGLKTAAIDVNGNPDAWKIAHLLHLIDTNLSVDFPNKSDRLFYNPPDSPQLKRNFAKYEWNAKLPAAQIDIASDFFRWSLGEALTLARGSDVLQGTTLDYYTFKQYLYKVQGTLALFQAGNIDTLIGLWVNSQIEKIPESNTPETRQGKIEAIKVRENTLRDILANMEIPNIVDYPLFRMILNIDPNQLPMPGTSYVDWLMDQTTATREVMESSAALHKIFRDYVQNDKTKNLKYATSPREGVEYDGVTKYAVWLSLFPLEIDYRAGRKNQPDSLDSVRNEIISLIQAYDEIPGKESSISVAANRRGRAFAYPSLFKAMLDMGRAAFKAQGFIKITHENKEYRIQIDSGGRLYIKDITSNQYRIAEDVLKAEDDTAKEMKRIFTERGGVWENLDNRNNLSKGLSLVDNIPAEIRLNLAKAHIIDRVYPESPKFNRAEVQALWLSFLGQVSVDGFLDKVSPGLITAQYEFDPENPTDFQGNDIAIELLSYFEPALFRQWINEFTFLNQNLPREDFELGVQGLRLTSETVAQKFDQTRFDETNGRDTSRFAFKALADEIIDDKATLSNREFANLIKKDGYAAGLKIIKGMIKNDVLLTSLAESEIFFGDLLYDLSHLSSDTFEKKYEKKDMNRIESTASMLLEGEQYTDRFLRGQFGTKAYDRNTPQNIGKLLEIYHVLRAAQTTKYKGDRQLGATAKHLAINPLSYRFVGPVKEHKIYSTGTGRDVVDHKFGLFGEEDLTLSEVDTHMKIMSSRTMQTHGESSIAITKAQSLNVMINKVQADMSDLVKDTDEIIKVIIDNDARQAFLSDSEGVLEPEGADWMKANLATMPTVDRDELWDVRRRIFETAENMKEELKIEVISRNGEVMGWRDLMTMTDYEAARYSIHDFIDRLFGKYPAMKRLEILAALKLRELYDVRVPILVDRALSYLEGAKTLMSVGGHYDSLLEMQALIDRYKQYKVGMLARWGSYMPHQYPIEVYKTWWYTEYEKLVRFKIVTEIKNERAKLARGKSNVDAELAHIDLDSPEGQKIVNLKVEKYLEHEWETFRVGNPSTYIIPNFLARRIPDNFPFEYIKGSTEMHYHYINNLMTGLRNDLMYSDWLTYLHKARRAGERSYLIELTKMWYADQVQNKMLHTKQIDLDDVTPGMQINFSAQMATIGPGELFPRYSGVQVWGVVDKVDKKNNLLHMKVNREAIIFRAKTSIASTEDIMKKMLVENQLSNASLKQIALLKNMLEMGYLTLEDFTIPLEKMTTHQAAKLIVKGYQWAIDNSDKIGIYNLDAVYTRNVRGAIQYKKFNRYMRRGAIEKLEGIAREYNNLKGDDGNFDSSMDEALYNAYRFSAWGTGALASAIKTSQALAFLGMVVAPKAWATNWLGAKMSNWSDAPVYHWTLSRKAKREWRAIEDTSPTRMNDVQREWNNTILSVGLGSNKDFTAIALQSGNLDPIDILSQEGTLDVIRYLRKGIIEGGEYQQYLQKLDDLRVKLVQSNFDRKVQREIMIEENLWRAKVNGIVTKKLYKNKHKLTLKGIKTTPEWALTPEEVGKAVSKVSIKMKKEGKRSFVEEANLTRTQALKEAAKFIKNSIIRGPLGLGLQAKAEVQRRPAFYIGVKTAESLGFNAEQQIILGINSVEYRHAYYSTAYKQFGANTKLGMLAFQFSQYAWNSFEKQYRLWKEALPQTMRHWTTARLSGKNIFQAFMDVVVKRTTNLVDANGKLMRTKKGKNIGEVNLIHYLVLRWVLGSMLMQAGSRLFYGLTNWQDPMVQLIYKISNAITDLFKGDLDDDDFTEMAWLASDMLFFLGVPYKLILQFAARDPNQDVTSSIVRGRIDDQLDFIYRVNNEISVLNKNYLRENPAYKRNLEQWEWWFDDFFTGVKFFGWSAPDKSGQPYPRWGYYPYTKGEFPFGGIANEVRLIKPADNMRYINTNKQGIKGLQRLWQHGIMEAPLTFIPFLDKAFYPHKKDRN